MTAKVSAGRLREAREYLGFSREDVAAALKCAPMLVAAMEDGTADPGPEMLEKFGRLYRRPLEWFRGEFKFEPGPGITRMLEGVKDPGDREGILDFAEFLQCKKQVDSAREITGAQSSAQQREESGDG